MDDKSVVVVKVRRSRLTVCEEPSIRVCSLVAVVIFNLVLAVSFSLPIGVVSAVATEPRETVTDKAAAVINEIARRLRSGVDLDGRMYSKLDEAAPKELDDVDRFVNLLHTADSSPEFFIACCLADVDAVFYRYGRLSSGNPHAEAVAERIAQAFVSDANFRDQYLRHYVWSRILIPDKSGRVSQLSAIKATFLDVNEHLKDKEMGRKFFWRDFMRIAVITVFLDTPAPTLLPKDTGGLQDLLLVSESKFSLDYISSLRPVPSGFRLKSLNNKQIDDNPGDGNLLEIPRSPSDKISAEAAMKALRDLHLRASDADVQSDDFYLGEDATGNQRGRGN